MYFYVMIDFSKVPIVLAILYLVTKEKMNTP